MIQSQKTQAAVQTKSGETSLFALRGFILMVLIALLFAAVRANAKGAYALYQFNGSFDSKCVPKVSNPAGVLSRNGISTRGDVSSGEVQALANGIAKVQHLLGGKTLPMGWRVNYNFTTAANARGKFTWNQGSVINVRRPAGTNGGQNETRLVHELGHKVGNAGAYGAYNRAVGRKCGITPYCTDPRHGGKRNEEFADSFAAYITRPSHLKTVCPEAYAFFSKTLFPGSDAASNCSDTTDGGSSMMMASAGGRSNSDTPATDTFDRRQCTNLLCWLFGIGRTYKTKSTSDSDPGSRSHGNNGGDR